MRIMSTSLSMSRSHYLLRYLSSSIVGIVCAHREMRPQPPPPTLPMAPPPALNSSDQLEEDQFTAVVGPWWSHRGVRPKQPPPTLPMWDSPDPLEEHQFTAVAGPWWPSIRPRLDASGRPIWVPCQYKQPPPHPPHPPQIQFVPLSAQHKQPPPQIQFGPLSAQYKQPPPDPPHTPQIRFVPLSAQRKQPPPQIQFGPRRRHSPSSMFIGSWCHDGPDWISTPVSQQADLAKLVGENSVQLVAWYAEMPPSIVCLGWSCSKGEDVSKPLQRWFEHG